MRQGNALYASLERLQIEPTDYSSLLKAYSTSEEVIACAREKLAQDFRGKSNVADCVVFGSVARKEVTALSDLDYIVTTENNSVSARFRRTPRTVYALLQDCNSLGIKLGPPGRTGIFGKIVPVKELSNNIGLQADTNDKFTRRILLLEESVSLISEERHKRLLREIFEAYLSLRVENSTRPPRVLVNDVIRYWRTIAVDYHAKSSRDNCRYSLRYLKLLFSRKLCYFSSILALSRAKDDALGFLCDQFTLTPMLRIVSFFEDAFREDDVRSRLFPELEIVLSSMDYFIEKMGDETWRENIDFECKTCNNLAEMPNFDDARNKGIKLHQALTRILLDPLLRPFTQEYVLL